MVTTIVQAVDLVREVCRLSNVSDRFLDASSGEAKLLRRAIRDRDTPALYEWLMEGFSLQGISDRIAWDYIERHGNATWQTVDYVVKGHRCRCPKLDGFEAYRRCGYRKTAATCQNPADLPDCPVPMLPLRKGDLNQQAFSLYYFLRDRCQGDLVGFIEGVFAEVDRVRLIDPVSAKREQLTWEFSSIHAVSSKLIAMMLGTLLMAGGPKRPDWLRVGRSLVTIDSLVHNFLHRTGILQAFDQDHRYGTACHGPRGCAAVIYQLADRIDGRDLRPSYPAAFPRLIEVAIWSFCAETEGNVCNGRNIDDRAACEKSDCQVGDRCGRVRLRLDEPAQIAERK